MTQASHRSSLRRRTGFSLVEMIGVLAIIAILAVIIVPKVFATINSARITTAVGAVSTVRTAVTDFAGKYGAIPVIPNANARIDDLLLATGLLESRFAVKIGTQPTAATPAAATWAAAAPWIPLATPGAAQTLYSRVVCVNVAPAAAPGTGTNYFLDGTTPIPAGSRIVSAVITGLTTAEARELSQKIDGDLYTETNTTTVDTRGRVAYNLAGATRTVWIYLASQ